MRLVVSSELQERLESEAVYGPQVRDPLLRIWSLDAALDLAAVIVRWGACSMRDLGPGPELKHPDRREYEQKLTLAKQRIADGAALEQEAKAFYAAAPAGAPKAPAA